MFGSVRPPADDPAVDVLVPLGVPLAMVPLSRCMEPAAVAVVVSASWDSLLVQAASAAAAMASVPSVRACLCVIRSSPVGW